MVSQQLKERSLAVYTKTFADTTIKDISDEFPKFAFSELTLGKTLGEGGFGVVSEILAFDISQHDSHRPESAINVNDPQQTQDGVEVKTPAEEDDPDFQGRKFIADHCIRNDSDARYAIKILKKSLVEKGDDNLLVKAMADMAVETHILSAIEHPNIVKIRGTSSEERYDPSYFIVMDRLYDTLEKRLKTWAESVPRKAAPPLPKPAPAKRTSTGSTASSRASALGCLFGRRNKSQEFQVEDDHNDHDEDEEEDAFEAEAIRESPSDLEKKNKLLEERLVASYDLSAAIAYLHERNIIYRDIKPENCAFDVRGDIKLFDFGTAKELPHQNDKKDKTFHLTGMTGSLPWMSPEVVNSHPYNHKADIFSFVIMLWQIMAMEMPFKKYESDLRLFWEEVHKDDGPKKRPEIPKQQWPKPVELCLRRGWAHNPSERMEMKQIENILRKEIVRVRKGNEDGLRHDRRRSTFVFRR